MIKGSRVRVPDRFICMFTSAAQLVHLRLSGVWIACDSCTEKTHWDHSERVGESPGPEPKSESLELNGNMVLLGPRDR
jgi:hypothetical protein